MLRSSVFNLNYHLLCFTRPYLLPLHLPDHLPHLFTGFLTWINTTLLLLKHIIVNGFYDICPLTLYCPFFLKSKISLFILSHLVCKLFIEIDKHTIDAKKPNKRIVSYYQY